MKYILYNVFKTIKEEKSIFLVMIICIVSSAFILNFTYGLFYNFNMEKYHQNQSLKEVGMEINKSHAPTHKQIRKFVESLSDDTLKNTNFYFSSKSDTISKYSPGYSGIFESRFNFKNRKYGMFDERKKSMKEQCVSGRTISDKDEAEGANVAFVSNQINSSNSSDILIDQNNILLFNKNYTIIGREKNMSLGIEVPFLSVPDNVIYDDVMIITSEDIFNRSQYDEIQESAMENMPDAVKFPELPLPDTDSILLYNNLILITVLLAILAVLNFAILYDFIIEKRSKEVAVMRITGCSRIKAVTIHLLECIMLSVPIYVIGIFLYILFLNITLKNMFDYIVNAYNFKVYIFIFMFYIVAMLIIMISVILRNINQSIVSEWKEAKK